MAGRVSERKLASSDPAERTLTILIVEDEYLVRASLSDYLQDSGFKVLEASNATEAIEIIEKTGVQLHLIFSDVLMPGPIDGFGFAHWIRANRPSLPIILTSGAFNRAACAEELRESESFMAKPYNLEAVVSRMRAVLGAGRT